MKFCAGVDGYGPGMNRLLFAGDPESLWIPDHYAGFLTGRPTLTAMFFFVICLFLCCCILSYYVV